MKNYYSLSDFGVTKHEGVLANGLRVVFIEKPFAPIHARMVMRAGAMFDHPSRQGLAHFSEHIIAAGSEKYFKEKFWSIMASVGGFYNASTSNEWMSVQCEVAESAHLKNVKQYFTHALTNVHCSEKGIASEQDIIISEIKRRDCDLHIQMQEGVNNTLGNGTSWRTKVIGTVDSVSSITATDVENFFSEYCCVENMVLAIAGGSTWQEIQDTFSDIPFLRGKKHKMLPDPPLVEDRDIWLDIQSPEVMVLSMFAGPHSETREFYLLSFALGYLHDGLTSHFFNKIRTEKGLAYGVGYRMDYFDKIGYFGTSVGVPRGRVEKTFEAINEAYGDILKKGITQKQIDDKLNTMWFSEKRSLERSVDLVNKFALPSLYPDEVELFGEYPDIFNYRKTFKADEMNDVLRNYAMLDRSMRICTGIR